MARRKPKEPDVEIHPCAAPGCAEPASYRAPASRERLNEYRWFCIEHIREFNRSWDYFKGMSGGEIESFMQDALTGHRPTWTREGTGKRKQQEYMDALEEGLARFFRWGAEEVRQAHREHLPVKERRALATLDLEDRVGVKALKTHYRKLVKLHHPDLHGGNTQREEAFKRINAAYTYLLKLYEGN